MNNEVINPISQFLTFDMVHLDQPLDSWILRKASDAFLVDAALNDMRFGFISSVRERYNNE